MSALTVTVERCHGRFLLGRDTPAERDRLRRLQRRALGEPLAEALAAAGIREEWTVCVRSLAVRLTVGARADDDAVVAALARLVARGVVEARERGEAIVYPSRPAALADLLRRVAARDLSRAWAWAQLGLWSDPPGEGGSPVLRALLAERAAIVPVLARLAPEPAVAALLRAEIEERGWRTLARAALLAAGHRPGVEDDLLASAPPAADLAAAAEPERGVMHAPPTPALVERVAAALRRSRIVAALLHAAPAPPPAEALAVLALLEADPAALALGRSAPRAVAVAVGLLRAARAAAAPVRPAVPSPAAATAPVPARTPAVASQVEDTPSTLAAAAVTDGSAATPLDPDDDPADAVVPGTGQEPEPGWRAEAATRFAGLLFVLHPLGEPAGVRGLEDDRLAARSIRWVLHRLGALLAPGAAPDDPARLAFCGLGPDAPRPDVDAPLATPAEERALLDLADLVTVQAARRLGHPRARAAEAVADLVLRRGAVVADPGWIEVRLSLDEVTTEVRRAGLDCDPGWLPWLGAVVRFVYE